MTDRTRDHAWQSMATAPRDGAPIEIRNRAIWPDGRSCGVVQWMRGTSTSHHKDGSVSRIHLSSYRWKHVGYACSYAAAEQNTEWRPYRGAMPTGPDRDPPIKFSMPSRRKQSDEAP